MQRREKINKIRQLLSNPPQPQPDLSNWTDEDLRWVIAMGDKYGKDVINPRQLNEDELKVYNEITNKYKPQPGCKDVKK